MDKRTEILVTVYTHDSLSDDQIRTLIDELRQPLRRRGMDEDDELGITTYTVRDATEE